MESENNPVSKLQKYFYLILMAALILTGSICSSILAPIYPLEAAAKSISASEFGFVFGVFQLVYIFIAPVYGVFANTIGPTLMFKAGTFMTSLCTISFGFLSRLPSGKIFLILSITLRVLSAIGDSAVYISGYILASGFFPKATATAVAVVETSYCVGIIIGPTIGSSLYVVGGFSLPFFVIGAILMIFCLSSILLFKTKSSDAVENTDSNGPRVTNVLRNPRLNLPQTMVGSIFMAMMGGYAISSVIWGRLADKFGHFNVLMVVGLITMVVGLLFIGPAPFIPLQLTVVVVVTSLFTVGAGSSCVIMNSFMDIRRAIAGDESPRNVAVNGFVSGLYTSVIALGYFVGPTVGGPLYDSAGFPIACMVMVGLELLGAFLVLMVNVINCAQTVVHIHGIGF